MLVNRLTRIATIALLAVTINGCASTSALNMMDALGGTQGVTKLAGNFLQSAASNGSLGSLLKGKDLSSITPIVSDQLCSLMGGGCKAPLTSDQIAAGAKKLSPTQANAVGSVFSDTLNALKQSPAAQEAIKKAVGPSLGGIIGAVL